MDLNELRDGLLEISQDESEEAINNWMNTDLEVLEASMARWQSMNEEEAFDEMYEQSKDKKIPLSF